MNEERRRLLGIPVHKEEKEHTYVDGYCNCGQKKPPNPKKKIKSAPLPGRTTPRVNIDLIEGNWSEYR